MGDGKKPQDHKAKKPKVETVDGGRKVTIDGLTVTITDDAMNDYEVFEHLAAAQKGDKASIPLALSGLLGDELPAVKDHLRDPETGRLSTPVMLGYIESLFEALNPNS